MKIEKINIYKILRVTFPLKKACNMSTQPCNRNIKTDGNSKYILPLFFYLYRQVLQAFELLAMDSRIPCRIPGRVQPTSGRWSSQRKSLQFSPLNSRILPPVYHPRSSLPLLSFSSLFLPFFAFVAIPSPRLSSLDYSPVLLSTFSRPFLVSVFVRSIPILGHTYILFPSALSRFALLSPFVTSSRRYN